MPEQKTFLLLALGMGAAGIIIGAITIMDIIAGINTTAP